FTDYEGTSELKYLDDKYRRNNKTITETHPFKITQKESMEFRFFLIAQLLNNEEFSFSGNSGKKYTFSLKLEIIDENENSIYSFQEEFITLSFNKRSDRFIIIQNAKP
ncbi:MAG: hypothetical protein ACPG5P_02910, partial [Saprospiraceae bacterium]